jgi:hypothetical protein
MAFERKISRKRRIFVKLFDKRILKTNNMKPSFAPKESLWTKTILLTTLLAGTLDILSAYTTVYIRTGEISKKMFQYIAGGALGLETSMKGGWGVIALGVFFHYFIAFSFTLFFFLIYQRARLYRFNKYITGLIYGLFAWVIMNLVVLQLSALPAPVYKLQGIIVGASVLMVMIGLPISLSASNYYKKQANRQLSTG